VGPVPEKSQAMTFVSATRLRLHTKLRFLSFAYHALRSALQAKRSDGFLGGFLGGDAQGGAWTITTWVSEEDMRAFRNSGAHKTAMPKLLKLCDEASFAHWVAGTPGVPTVEEAYERVKNGGHLSKVNKPSAAHAAGRTVSEGVPRAGLNLKPRKSPGLNEQAATPNH
jgi:hypothetical protein